MLVVKGRATCHARHRSWGDLKLLDSCLGSASQRQTLKSLSGSILEHAIPYLKEVLGPVFSVLAGGALWSAMRPSKLLCLPVHCQNCWRTNQGWL